MGLKGPQHRSNKNFRTLLIYYVKIKNIEHYDDTILRHMQNHPGNTSHHVFKFLIKTIKGNKKRASKNITI
jgi:hypothetical protein